MNKPNIGEKIIIVRLPLLMKGRGKDDREKKLERKLNYKKKTIFLNFPSFYLKKRVNNFLRNIFTHFLNIFFSSFSLHPNIFKKKIIFFSFFFFKYFPITKH